MWKTIAEASIESGVHRTTLNKAAVEHRLGEAAHKSCATWMIDTEHPDYIIWLEQHKTWLRVRNRSNAVIKTQGPGPS